MGSWQPIGLTEGLWRVVAAPPPLAFSERSPPHGFATGRIGNGSSPPQNCVSLLRGKGLPRQCPAAAGPPCALPDFEEGESRSELAAQGHAIRSEEHTSELQSLMRISYAVFCLKKKKHPSPRIRSNTYNSQPTHR